jgi:hypothetical protein
MSIQGREDVRVPAYGLGRVVKGIVVLEVFLDHVLERDIVL